MEKFALEVTNISKKFRTDFWKKQFTALEDVSFQVPQNSVCGLIGPNGAGKTTAIKVILGFIRANSGNVKIFGEDSENKNTHKSLGYLPESAYYYDYLKPVEFLEFYAKLFEIPKNIRDERIENLLKLVGLSEKKDVRLRGFSKGMLQRIGIAQALVNDPQLVIFDEPMSGLDPVGRKEVRDIILKLKENGKTVLFSTHILPDVENLCDHVVMIVNGKVKASGLVDQLIRPNVQSFDVVVDKNDNLGIPTSWTNDVQVRHFEKSTSIRFKKTEVINQQSILSWVKDNQISMVSFTPHKESLEDILVKNMERTHG
jgi:ABC-2 type transport system ATP-binding protein